MSLTAKDVRIIFAEENAKLCEKYGHSWTNTSPDPTVPGDMVCARDCGETLSKESVEERAKAMRRKLTKRNKAEASD